MRAEAGRGVLVLLLASCSLGCVEGGRPVLAPSVDPDQPAGPEPAAHAFYGGVFLGEASSTPERVAAAVAEYTAEVGKKPALVKTFHSLGADLSANGWAGRVVREVARVGSTNFIALDLEWSGRPSGSLLNAIVSGAGDARLVAAARALAQINGVVLVEPAWEMNGNWNYSWQGVANGANDNAPALYRAAWKHVVDVFRANGATNVRWVFNPNTGNSLAAGSPGASHWNWWGNYYPGDSYVDYVGAHGYNGPGVWNTPYHTFDDLFYGRDSDNVLTDMARRYPNKPIIIGEMGAEETPGRDKGEWIKAAYAQMQADPRIAGAIWFNMKKEADWRIDSSASSLRAYRAAMSGNQVREAYDDAGVNARILAAR